jgi:hypothetical protein
MNNKNRNIRIKTYLRYNKLILEKIYMIRKEMKINEITYSFSRARDTSKYW